MSTPALMSLKGWKGHNNPALPPQQEAQAPTTLSVHSSTTYCENQSNDLRARFLITTKEPDLPQVESNLNKSPQEYLAVTVECIEV
jgi:hypothetical protein